MIGFRPVRRSDAPAIHRLMGRVERYQREPISTPLVEIEEWFTEPYFDSSADARILEEGDEAIAFGRIWHQPSGERFEQATLVGCVDPAHRRRGLGTALFEWQLERGRDILAGYGDGLPRYLRTFAWDWVEDAQRLYERHGFQPVRWFEHLARPLDPPLEVGDPPGVTIAPWDAGREKEVREVHNQAFAEHWGSTPDDVASWEHELSAYSVRRDLSFLALAGDEVIGYSLTEHYPADEAVAGRKEGWVGVLGVLRDWRRRGVASALIAASLRAFAEAGFTHAAIGVDSENPSGAAGLYRRLGFQPLHRSVSHRLEV